ncbi:serine/threonine-protein kinase pelle [Musca vetustissima]|uniref:serine/threonine-protein kinase pelle n=1 Tax=Musca vetustissima TaxID=27455 RepID=UPI002AB7611D|nr:serine/threonine-protein kinase pelle [Musca vetustissima]
MSAATTKSRVVSAPRIKTTGYIYDLPLSVTRELCNHLDGLGIWRQVAQTMNFSEADIQSMARKIKSTGESPTNELLNIWGGKYNHKILELYKVLYKLKAFQGMRILKDYVPREFTLLIPESEPAFSQILPSECDEGRPRTNNNNHMGSNSPSSGIISSTNSTIVSSDNNNTSHNRNNNNNNPSWRSRSNLQPANHQPPHQPVTEKIINKHHDTGLPEIDYKELTVGTNNWDERYRLGKGGFGIVYRGVWKMTDVAIKLMTYKDSDGQEQAKIELQQSRNELNCLYRYRHDNILPIYGYCITGEKPCLVYQLMRRGALYDHLNTNKYPPLTMQKRINISAGTAKGLLFLHTLLKDKSLIHCDIKPGNILLDQCLQPKIGDFGLAREGPGDDSYITVDHVYGTRGYLPPEFADLRRLSKHVDTFSFGVVLLEMFTGLPSVVDNKKFLKDYIKLQQKTKTIEQLMDKRAELSDEEKLLCRIGIEWGLECIRDDPLQRPNMEVLVKVFNSYAAVD